jgi:hypothetical protein
MSPCTSKRTPSLASEDDAERLMGLLCSASLEIGLTEGVCSAEKLPQYVNWMRKQCQARRAWMLCEDGALLGRNEPSRQMLLRCGFQDTGDASQGHPILSWRRSNPSGK